MRQQRHSLKAALITALMLVPVLDSRPSIAAEDAIVYSVARPLDLGVPPAPEKDYFVNVGTANGVRAGTLLEVNRKIPTFDLSNNKLYKEISFPIGVLKVIHSEPSASVARLEKMFPLDKTPGLSPRSVMVGDTVRVTR